MNKKKRQLLEQERQREIEQQKEQQRKQEQEKQRQQQQQQALEARQRKRNTLMQFAVVFLFPVVLIYYELVFRASTSGGSLFEGIRYIVMFSVVYALIGYLLATLSKYKLVNFLVTLLLVVGGAVPFLVEFFIYKQFKVFYDLNTMLAGASDALSEYTQELYALIFSFDGLSRIFLFLLPTVIFLVLGWKLFTPRKIRLPAQLIVAIAAAAAYLFCVLDISQSPTHLLMYEKEYSYQVAVPNFGLLTGLRLDIQNNLFGSEDPFEIVQTIPQFPEDTTPSENTEPPVATVPDETEGTGTTPVETTPPTTEPPVVYTHNKMDIDFASLSASGTKKELNSYVASLSATSKNPYTGLFKGKNLILISAEAFSAEVIDPELTPTLYRLATKGIQFTDYYQPASAGTTGGEYQNLFGLMPTRAGSSFKLTASHVNYFTMGNQLDRLGYYGAAFHNNSYTYYDRHKTHVNLGYSEGFMGYGNGMEKYVSRNWPQSDLEMIAGTLETYIDKQPFNIYYMTVSGHNNYTPHTDTNDMTDKNWSRVEHLDYSVKVRGYLAANMELENALAHLVARLEEEGIADDTVICLATDHFPYGLDNDAPPGNMPYLSELYGYEVTNYIQRDHSRLILWCGMLEDMAPIVVDTPTFSLDILPTLSNLFGTEFDSRLMPGRDVFSEAPALVFNMNYDWKTEYGTYLAKTGTFTPVNDSVQIPSGYVDTIKAIVRNKIRYCQGVLETDYFRYLFGDKA